MNITRRQALAWSAGTAAMVSFGLSSNVTFADEAETDAAIKEFLGGAEAQTGGKLTLTAPEIAENGNTVPISVDVDSAMSGDDMVDTVVVYADNNPAPGVVTFHFTEMSGSASATTRMRLATTQNVIAVAKMKDGTFYMDKKQVKVTIGGCGG